jgi:hypothetical protein
MAHATRMRDEMMRTGEAVRMKWFNRVILGTGAVR